MVTRSEDALQVDAFGLIVVGDEILNGRRQDRHLNNIGELLRSRGFGVAWLRILPDDPGCLASELRATMLAGRPVVCCGGIGATPDDHTRASAACAADVPLVRHPDAVAELEARFGDEAYPHRIKMADLPQGSELIPNPYNRVPGFSLRHHYFVPGFPDMATPMVAWVLDTHFAEGGSPEHQCGLRVYGVPESALMELMQQLSRDFPSAKLFSLPRLGPEYQIEMGFRGRGDLVAPFSALCQGLDARGLRYELLQQPEQH